jgi:hypothetical protein
MKTLTRFSAMGASALVACAWFTAAGATGAQAVFNLEGEPTCKSLSPDDDTLEIEVFHPDAGTASDKHKRQLIDYAVDSHNELSWEVAKGMPLNYVILTTKGRHSKHSRHKKRASSTVYSYGSTPGSRIDSGLMVGPGTAKEGSEIKTLRFCYGISELREPVVMDIGSCDDLNNRLLGKSLDLTEFASSSCPPPKDNDSSDERIILSLNPNEKNFGLVFCTCNLNDSSNGKFEQCDPDVDQTKGGEAGGGVGGSCSSGEGFVERLPISITGVEDPESFLCFAVTGSRDCFFHFGDK